MSKHAAMPKDPLSLLDDPNALKAAFDATAPERAALRDDQRVHVIVSVPRVVSLVLGVIPNLATLRDELHALPSYNVRYFDQLSAYALQLAFAQKRYTNEDQGAAVAALIDEGEPLRAELLKWAPTLVNWGVFDETKVAAIQAGSGKLDHANDLVDLSALYRDAWKNVDGKAPVERTAVERAAVVGQRLVAALGAQAHTSSTARDERDRAFALFRIAYDEVERGVTFVRWHQDDAERFAPTIFSTRRPRRTARAADAASPKGAQSPGTSAPTGGQPSAPPQATTTPSAATGIADNAQRGNKTPAS